MRASATHIKELIVPGSEEEFITEHYWGYTKISDRKTSAYEVQHPKWKIHRVQSFEFSCAIEKLYGHHFKEALAGEPTSVFLADGSEINVMNKQTLA